MRKYCGAIYKKARKDANLTQEQASELLPIPKRTLSAYENGDLLPLSLKWRIVRRMKINRKIKKCPKKRADKKYLATPIIS